MEKTPSSIKEVKVIPTAKNTLFQDLKRAHLDRYAIKTISNIANVKGYKMQEIRMAIVCDVYSASLKRLTM